MDVINIFGLEFLHSLCRPAWSCSRVLRLQSVIHLAGCFLLYLAIVGSRWDHFCTPLRPFWGLLSASRYLLSLVVLSFHIFTSYTSRCCHSSQIVAVLY